MPYKMQTEGVEKIEQMLKTLGTNAEKAAAKGLFNGAGIMQNEIEKGAEAIKTEPFWYATNGKTRLPSPEEKAVMMAKGGPGIAKFRKDGYNVDTAVGYSNAGYAMMKGKKVPIPLIVNAVNSGTSFMQKQPFIRKAVSTGQKKASDAISQTIEDQIKAMTEN